MGVAQWNGVRLFRMLLVRWDEDLGRKGGFKRRH